MKKLAYLILAHADAEHLKRLIRCLNESCDIYLHIDAKADLDDFKECITEKNVFVVQDRVSVAWAGISIIDATIKLIESAVNSGEDYSHLVFLSGADYPIKKASYIQEYLNCHANQEFIKFFDMRESPDHHLKLVFQKWFKEPFYRGQIKSLVILDKIFRRGLNSLNLKNNWDHHITPYFGSNWIALTLECSKYVLDYHNNNPEFYAMNKLTFSSDEHYIQTIVGNSKFVETSTGPTQFIGEGTYYFANLHIIDPSLSKWFRLEDYEQIERSDKLFVRKVSTKESQALLDKIDEEILFS